MSVVLDVLTLVIIIPIIWRSYSKGLIKGLIELVGFIAAIAAALILSKPAGSWIYQHLLKNSIYGLVSNYLKSVSGGVTDTFNSFLSQYGVSSDALGGQTIAAGQTAVNQTVMNSVVAPVAESIARVIALVLIFFVCILIVRIIAGSTDVVFKLPLIGTVNRIGGIAVGVLKSTIVMLVVCTLLAMLIPIFSLQKNPPITNTTISNTYVLKYIYNVNPLKDILLKK